MRILAVDPGPSCGVAWADFHAPSGKPLWVKTDILQEFGPTCDELEYRLMMDDFDLVVVEKFTINAGTIKKDTKGSKYAIELTGVIRYAAWSYRTPLEEQAPADAMNFVTNDKLKRLGYYTPGPDHANDAMRHLILAAVRHKQINLQSLIH